MKKKITFLVLFFLGFMSAYAEDLDPSEHDSTYTSIDQKDCITLDSDNMGSIQECESFMGIGVKVIEGDIRQSIILTRNEKEYDLEFWSTISPDFSTLGLQIEWRHEKKGSENLKGMIVRFEVNDDPENMDTVSSYLVVSKITAEDICVVAKILPQKNQNAIARQVLDSKDELPCLKNLKKDRK